VDFSRGSLKEISRGCKSGEISFFLIEIKKNTFYPKNVKFQNAGGKDPLSDANVGRKRLAALPQRI